MKAESFIFLLPLPLSECLSGLLDVARRDRERWRAQIDKMADARLSSAQQETMFTNHHKVEVRPVPRILFLAVCVLVMLGSYALPLLTAAGRLNSSPTRGSRQASHRGKARLPAAPNLPVCPNTTAPILKPSSQTGHHKVTLTWKASPSSSGPSPQVVGYCLYRSTTANPASEKPPCRDCEWINKRAIAGTACVDDLVQDGTLYYYVVEAITQERATSSFSNQAPAQIPPNTKPSSSVAQGSYPLCRASNASQ
jgi:hypothetical protein